MQLSGGNNFRKHAYTLSLPAIGVPFVAEIEEHWHRPCNRHAHDETQLIVMLAGAIRVVAGGQEIVARAGEGAVIPSGVEHYVGGGDADPKTVYIDARFAPSTGPLHGYLYDGRKLLVRSARPNVLPPIARQLSAAVRSTGPSQAARVIAVLWQLTAELSGSGDAPADTTIDRRLHAAERFMKERLATAVSVDDLAAISGLSRSQLCRLYAKTLGVSPAARLRQLRIEQAEHLLAHSTLSVKEVAHVCGFACQNHFSRVFSELKGKTPSAMRT